ncbi:hypothetical protein [Polyangium aurulentum]|uniref:hypothetical protein n=1 Tax=Polyangium aurulentum TaxID=2567896 RepID=UPI0010ADBEF0|nr:hypothetical protein [Polyangium aurulentum]UQA61838.1 hypothetical protein E8A73_015745 [Polyangium aurulentum]
MSGPRSPKQSRARAEGAADEIGEKELPTEFCLGSDGCIYVNVEGTDPEKIEGRKMFHGYAMTREETEVAMDEIHRLAFNVTVAVQDAMRRQRARKRKRR